MKSSVLAGILGLGGQGCDGKASNKAEGLLLKPTLRQTEQEFQLDLKLPYGGLLRLTYDRTRKIEEGDEIDRFGNGGSSELAFYIKADDSTEFQKVTSENHDELLDGIQLRAVEYLRGKLDDLTEIVNLSDDQRP